ncbi:MAG: TonB-dependent receptor [Gammaproteobacteria bacterium]|jgi:iron complex outermembrane receptor protein|nr:TonB-dependent receptor [Gammaproteobacteria bacterium]
MSFHQPDIATAKIAGAAIISIIAFTHCTPLQAGDDELFFEMPVVLSASRLEQPRSETPMAVTSIDRELIEASGARSIPEVLRLVPGIVVGNSVNEWGEESKLIVSYHGHTDQYSKQMQVLIDGRSVYEPLLGGVDWNMLPINLEDIERIEVLRGPNSSSYGSNSFLGVINIITRHASEDPGHYVQLRAGNHDIADLTYRYGGNSGKLDYRVTASTQNDDGLDARKNISTYDTNGDVTNYLYADEYVDNHDDSHTGAIDYRLDYQIDQNSRLSYQGGFGKTNLDINENFALAGTRPVRDSDTSNAYQHLKLEQTINRKNSLVAQYYYNRQKKVDQSTSKIIQLDSFDPFTLDLDFGLKSERHNLELTHFNQTTDSLRLIWGLSAQQDISESNYWLNAQGTIRRETYRLFGNAEWQIDQNNLLNFGALVEDSDTLTAEISPRLALIHKFNHQHSLRFGISKAVRSPFIAEESGNTVFSHELTIGGEPIGTAVDQQLIPNHELGNETIISREIGYFGQFLADTLRFDARIFHDRLDDLIQQKSVPVATDTVDRSAQIHRNMASTDVSGVEIVLDYQADASLRFFGSAAYLEITSNDNPRTTRSGEFENSAPKRTASLLAIKQFNEHYSGSLGLYYAGDMQWLDVPKDEPSSYTTMDLMLSKSFRQSGSLSKLSLVLKNLLGEYNNYHHQPDIGPRAELNLTGYIEYSISFN